MKPLILAIDFDHTVHDAANPIKGRRMGGPMAGAKEALEGFKKKKYEIIIHTVWGGTDQGRETIKKWMDYYQIPFDSITNIKPNATFFIDDKAVHFTNWEELKNI